MRSPGLERPQLGQFVEAWCALSSPSWVDRALGCLVGTGSPDQQERANPQSTPIFKSLSPLCLFITHRTKQVMWPESVWEELQIFTVSPRPVFCRLRLNAFQLITEENVTLIPGDFLVHGLLPALGFHEDPSYHSRFLGCKEQKPPAAELGRRGVY